MTTREYLESYQYLEKYILHAEDKLKKITEEVASLQAIDYSKEKIQASPQNDPIGNLVIEVTREKAVVGMKLIGYRAKKNLIDNQVEKLKDIDPKSYILLYEIYIAGMGNYNKRMKYSSNRSFYRDLSKAESLFEKCYGITYRNL